jgi:phosphatidylserine/phosphatidylglycerophosphate/cardiolipin synthase-like enzyme
LHSRIDGPAAYDILTNFKERWLRESKLHGIRRLIKASHDDDDALLRIERIPAIIGIGDIPRQSQNDPEDWHVQVGILDVNPPLELYFSILDLFPIWFISFFIFVNFPTSEGFSFN